MSAAAEMAEALALLEQTMKSLPPPRPGQWASLAHALSEQLRWALTPSDRKVVRLAVEVETTDTEPDEDVATLVARAAVQLAFHEGESLETISSRFEGLIDDEADAEPVRRTLCIRLREVSNAS